jgi:DNA polymerase I-like protein with 3'-5' exonuclease and polymerase domains
MQLPAIRKLILPDPNKVIIDIDMAGADAQVVAWEAGDEDLKQAFKNGLKVHQKNFEDFYQKPFKPEYKYKIEPGHVYSPYDEMKRAVHGTNYGAGPRTLAATLQWKISEAEHFQRRWLKQLHPAIGQWHKRIDREVQLTRTVRNKFGYSITYFGRPSEVLPQALAWIPQSSVGILAAKAAVELRRRYGKKSPTPWLTISLQVHDSLVLQIPRERWDKTHLALIRDAVHQPIPYPEALNIQWAIAASTKSWGDVKEVTWDGDGLT